MSRLFVGIVFVCLLGFGATVTADQNYYVAVGSFEDRLRADAQLQLLQKEDSTGLHQYKIVQTTISGTLRYRVTSGPLGTYQVADLERQRLEDLGHQQAWILQLETANPQAPSKTIAETNQAQRVVENTPGLPNRLTQEQADSHHDEPSSSASTEAYQRDSLIPGLIKPETVDSRGKQLSQQSHIQIRNIELDSTVLQSEIEQLAAQFEGREVSVEALLGLKEKINQLFVINGYVNSGVMIPDQQIRDGNIVFEMTEGQVTAVAIDGQLRSGYIEKRLDITSPFNLEALQASLKQLEKDPFVRRLDANITPGNEPGMANLKLDVETSPKVSVGVTFANNRSPSIGSENTQLQVNLNNLSGWGDSTSVSTSITEGLNAENFDFSIPVNSWDHKLSVRYSSSDSSVIEEPFNSVDVESETEIASIGLDVPVFRNLENQVAVHLNFETRKNKTSLLGQPFSFSEGAVNGETRVAPVRLGASYSTQKENHSFATRATVSIGTSSFDATPDAGQANGDFTSYLVQAQYSQRLNDKFYFTTKVLAQIASDPLLSVEKFSLGGVGTVRGYRQNQIVRDNVYLTSVEGRYKFDTLSPFEFVGFVDWGGGENHSDALSQGNDELYSVGLGVNYRDARGLSAELYVAHGFKDVVVMNKDLQDDGIHFRLGYHHAF